MFKPSLNSAAVIVVRNEYMFASVGARDTYFASHFSELYDNLYVYITGDETLQQYKVATSSFIDINPVIKGGDGAPGADGTSITVSVQADAPADPSSGDIWVDTDDSLALTANDSTLWNGQARPTFAGNGGRVLALNSTATALEFPTNLAIPGAPTAATAVINTNTTQLATTAYVYRIQSKTRQFNRCAYLTDSTNVELKMNSCGGLDRAATLGSGHKLYYFPFCVGGETTIDINVSKGSNRCMFDLYINGVLDSSGYDLYNSSTVDATVTISLTQAITAGFNEIRIVVNGKNGSSTGYDPAVYGVRIR